MALKFTEKLKGIDLGKGKESLSEVASSVSKLFDRKNRESTASNVKENIDVEYELENILEPTTQNIVKEESEHILYQKVSQYVADNIDKFQQWYSDSQLDEKLTAVAKKVGATLIYPVLLLYSLLKSTDTKAGDKCFIIASLAYFIMPADVIPDIIIGLGYSDDALALTAALKKISSSITPELMELTKKQCGELIGPVDDKVIGEIKTQLKYNKDTEESLISEGKFHNDKKKTKQGNIYE